jgi:hypothetical protein
LLKLSWGTSALDTWGQRGDESSRLADTSNVGLRASGATKGRNSALQSTCWDVLQLSRNNGGQSGDGNKGLHFESIEVSFNEGYEI